MNQSLKFRPLVSTRSRLAQSLFLPPYQSPSASSSRLSRSARATLLAWESVPPTGGQGPRERNSRPFREA